MKSEFTLRNVLHELNLISSSILRVKLKVNLKVKLKSRDFREKS